MGRCHSRSTARIILFFHIGLIYKFFDQFCSYIWLMGSNWVIMDLRFFLLRDSYVLRYVPAFVSERYLPHEWWELAYSYYKAISQVWCTFLHEFISTNSSAQGTSMYVYDKTFFSGVLCAVSISAPCADSVMKWKKDLVSVYFGLRTISR